MRVLPIHLIRLCLRSTHALLIGLLLWLPEAGLLLAFESPGGSAPRSPDPELLSVRLVPDSTTLRGKEASQRFVVMGQYSDGLERDLTLESLFSLGDSTLAAVDETGTVTGLVDGETKLEVEVEDLEATAGIRVEDSGSQPPLSFERNISPIFTKNGCNGSNCHGGVKGRGGFKLSLNSLSPPEDYKWISRGGVFDVMTLETDHPEIPRINLDEPDSSLLLKKPTMRVPHEGGSVISRGSDDYQTLLDWIEKGAPFQPQDGAPSEKIERVDNDDRLAFAVPEKVPLADAVAATEAIAAVCGSVWAVKGRHSGRFGGGGTGPPPR